MLFVGKKEGIMGRSSIPNQTTTASPRDRRAGIRDRRILTGTLKYFGEFLPVDIQNLSETGAYLVGPAIPRLDDCLILTFDLPSADGAVMVAGRVRRVTLESRVLERPSGFGIEFTRFFSAPGRRLLQTHLAA
jgi:hypothetical protein